MGIIIVVAVVAVVLIALFVIIAFKKKGNKKTEKDVLNTSKDLIAANAQTIEVLVVLAEGDASIIKELRTVQDKLQYLSPSTNEKVKAIDEKINDELGDLKIELSKSKAEDRADKVQTHLKNINLKIAERSTFTDRL